MIARAARKAAARGGRARRGGFGVGVRRALSGGAPTPELLSEILRRELSPVELDVQDTSGGCGSFFAVHVVSDKFSGMPLVKQHRLVNEVLGAEIPNMHGLTIKTASPEQHAKRAPPVK